MDWKTGVSLSMYQNAGEQEFETNWTEQVRRKKGQSAFPDATDVIGISSDFWNRYGSRRGRPRPVSLPSTLRQPMQVCGVNIATREH